MATVKRTAPWVDVEHGDGGTAALHYDSDAPLNVVLDFGIDRTRGRIAWTFARDLLADALTGLAGFGDVRCHASGVDFYLSLTSTDGQVLLAFATDDIRAFLVDAEDLVPYGSEHINFDAELDALLKDSAR